MFQKKSMTLKNEKDISNYEKDFNNLWFEISTEMTENFQCAFEPQIMNISILFGLKSQLEWHINVEFPMLHCTYKCTWYLLVHVLHKH